MKWEDYKAEGKDKQSESSHLIKEEKATDIIKTNQIAEKSNENVKEISYPPIPEASSPDSIKESMDKEKEFSQRTTPMEIANVPKINNVDSMNELNPESNAIVLKPGIIEGMQRVEYIRVTMKEEIIQTDFGPIKLADKSTRECILEATLVEEKQKYKK